MGVDGDRYGSIKLKVSFAKEPYKRDDIPQKRPIILSILLTVATPYDTTQHAVAHCNSCNAMQHAATHCTTLQ